MTRTVQKIGEWAALIVGTLLVGLFAFMIIGESLAAGGFIPVFSLTLAETLEFVAVLVMCGGTLLAWRWRHLGGGLMLSGGLAFIIVESLDFGGLRLIWFAVVFAVAGLVLLMTPYHPTT